MNEVKIRQLEARFQLRFNDFGLLIRAMTHSSYANEHNTRSNERLEFIGDAVLDLAVGKYLFEHLDEDEGVLTKKRAQDVCEGSLFEYAKSISLGDYLLLGKGEEKNSGREKPALLADAFEAFLGAIFLDKGFDEVQKVLEIVVYPRIKESLDREDSDYKSKLQELVQSDKRTLNYVIVSESGPAHDREFVARVYMDDDIIMGCGKGKSKKEAEQNAAKETLDKLASGIIDKE
ncbi:MAG TPA: ribonuclease III [Bacillota bacterium]|nr:ribonuclease III [Bacillota bacterium]HPF42726.1 ribonuclease III [Bacillota bacterium]HPJ85555.1 ribonuclease III [Bacillota bacterium]HPQ62055.1 ribonuclease III [Bacillota bacterium]HRX92036.1 ribonuclease III [Candidatus Izemoplasmatales bacterium]